MRAMILAAGLGTRLRPLTDDRPKALVEINGRTLLEITLARLRSFGICEVIINVHHFADMMVDYLKSNDNFGMRIEISREDVLLDTGGGLKKAAHFLLEGNSGQPFLLHNVDVISTIDLGRMIQFHAENQPLATLAVQYRGSSRQLVFDQEMKLYGRLAKDSTPDQTLPSSAGMTALAFTGIHVISPRIFSLMIEDGVFSIITAYLRLANQGEKILGFRADDYEWRDLGTPESLQQAAENMQRSGLPADESPASE